MLPADRHRTSHLIVFVTVAFGASWLVLSPLWIGGQGLSSPLLPVLAAAAMLTPSVGVLAVWGTERRECRGEPLHWTRRTGLGLGGGRRRTVGIAAATWIAVPVLVALAIALSAAVGVLDLDLTGLSGLRATGEVPSASFDVPGGTTTVLALTALQMIVIGTAVAMPAAFGEEWGWRGWLQPWLVGRWGRWPGLIATGVIWGLWHAPVTLLGYDYPGLGGWAAGYLLPFTVLVAIALGWLREATGSVWPAVVGHAAINATVGLVGVVADAASPPDTAVAGLTGWVGWVVLAAVVAALPHALPLAPRAPVLTGTGR